MRIFAPGSLVTVMFLGQSLSCTVQNITIGQGGDVHYNLSSSDLAGGTGHLQAPAKAVQGVPTSTYATFNVDPPVPAPVPLGPGCTPARATAPPPPR